MIAKVNRGKSFNSTIRYVLAAKKKAKIIFANFVEAFYCDVETIVEKFNTQASLNQRVKKPVYHLSLSPASQDSLSDADWTELIDELIDKLELDNNQVIAVLHQDTFFPNSKKPRRHVHIVANTINFDAKCTNFYYDYYKIENFLRDFERQKNLTQLDYELKTFWDVKEMDKSRVDKSQDKQPTTEKMGDALATQAKSELEKINTFKANEHDLRSTSIFHQQASSLKTGEPVFDGFDLIGLGMEGIAIGLKIANLLKQSNKNKKYQETLEKIVINFERVNNLESQIVPKRTNEISTENSIGQKLNPSSQSENKNLNRIQDYGNFKDKHLDNFISKAIAYLDYKTQEFEQFLKLDSDRERRKNVSPAFSRQGTLDKKQIGESFEENKKKLDNINNRLEKVQLEINSNAINPDDLYKKLFNYFKSIDDISNKPDRENYQISSKTLGEIHLISKNNNESVLIVKNGSCLYKAIYNQNNQWQTEINKLDKDTINKIKSLPSDKKEATKEYSGRYLASLLHNKLLEHKQNSQDFRWKFPDENDRIQTYTFNVRQSSNDKQILILGKDDTGQNIFKANINKNGLVAVENNKIPIKRLSDFIDQQNKNGNTHQENYKQLKKLTRK